MRRNHSDFVSYPPPRPIDRPDLRAVAEAEGFGEPGVAIAVERGRIPSARYRDMGRRCIDGVGAAALPTRLDPVDGRPLRGLDGPHPRRSDVRIGKAGEIERFVPASSRAILMLPRYGSIPITPAVSPFSRPARPVVTSDLDAVAGAQLRLYLNDRKGPIATQFPGLPHRRQVAIGLTAPPSSL